MKFWLGTHEVAWLARTDCGLFVSHRRLERQKRLPESKGVWCLDSGAFSELAMFGEFRTTWREYGNAIQKYERDVGGLLWAAPQDWMCEPFMIGKTGLNIREHQRRTINNWLDLQAVDCVTEIVPVLQGYGLDDYLRHVDMYAQRGIDVRTFAVVGVGSVCRRQGEKDIGSIFRKLGEMGIQCHGFGVKTKGLQGYQSSLISSDSMAWSYDARRLGYSWCGAEHLNCANCLDYALMWRDRLVKRIR